MIKIEHSVFALPFAYTGMVLAADGWPGVWTFLMLTIAMVAVRSFAMTFNRLADIEFDSQNPRTKDRPLVTGEISVKDAKVFLAATGTVFVLACAGLNWLCLALSPIPLIVSAFYSYTKRFTPLCHFVLGSTLGLAPVASWLGVVPEFTVTAWLFFFGVTFWVAGFDILYACQDADFDREAGLNSIPANLGIRSALAISWFSHICTVIFFCLAGANAGLGLGYWIVWAIASCILIYEHFLISEDDMSKVNIAFFTLNGIVGVSIFAGVLLGMWF